MGCGNAGQQSVEAIVTGCDNAGQRSVLSAKPVKSLPYLFYALERDAKDLSKQESTMRNVPRILKQLPEAMESLSEQDSKPVRAACGVIRYCVKAYNEGVPRAVLAGRPTMNVEYLKQCQHQLVVLLEKVLEKAHAHFLGSGTDCETSSKELRAISLATLALFELENYGLDCKQAFKESNGIAVAFEAIESSLDPKSGIKVESGELLAWVLRLFVDDAPQNVESIIACGSPYKLILFVAASSALNVPTDMLVCCSIVLEACLEHGGEYSLEDTEDMQQALDKSREAMEKRPSNMEKQISPLSSGDHHHDCPIFLSSARRSVRPEATYLWYNL